MAMEPSGFLVVGGPLLLEQWWEGGMGVYWLEECDIEGGGGSVDGSHEAACGRPTQDLGEVAQHRGSWFTRNGSHKCHRCWGLAVGVAGISVVVTEGCWGSGCSIGTGLHGLGGIFIFKSRGKLSSLPHLLNWLHLRLSWYRHHLQIRVHVGGSGGYQ